MQNLIDKLGLGDSTGALMLWIGLGVLLLVVVLAIATWLVRTLRPTLNLSGSGGRGGRPQRLAITDAFTLDRDGRKLVIIRRDNVEHLILIGGPNDVLVEQNIVRGERAFRERAPSRQTEADALQAAEAALTGEAPLAPLPGQSPLPPQPPAAPPPAALQQAPARPAPPPAPPPPPPRASQPMSPPPMPPQAMPPQPVAPPPVAAPPPAAPPQAMTSPPKLDDEFERALSAMQQQVALRHQGGAEPAPKPAAPPPLPPIPPLAPLPPRDEAQRAEPAPAAPPADAVARNAPPRPEPARADAARLEPMSEMARRLNEVLQKPMSGTLRQPFNRPIPPVPPTAPLKPPPVEPPPVAVPEAAPITPAPAGAAEMDMLEEEMARLLGRPVPPSKTNPP